MTGKPKLDAVQLGQLIREIGEALTDGLPDAASFVLVVAHDGDVYADGRVDEGETLGSFVCDVLDELEDDDSEEVAHGQPN